MPFFMNRLTKKIMIMTLFTNTHLMIMSKKTIMNTFHRPTTAFVFSTSNTNNYNEKKNIYLHSTTSSMRPYNHKNPLSEYKNIRIKSTSLFSTTSKDCNIANRMNTTSIDSTDGNNLNYEGASVYHTLNQSYKLLENNNISEPILSTCNLLSHVLNLPWNNGFSTLLSIIEQPRTATSSSSLANRIITPSESTQYEQLLKRRLVHNEPIQYIVGKWDFYDFTIECKEPVLIPRPETEELVEYVLHDIDIIPFIEQKQERIRILDVGCGTGCISIALFRQLSKLLPSHVYLDVVAVDISSDAISLTKRNVNSLLPSSSTNPNHTFTIAQSSIQNYSSDAPFDYIISNPPYIPSKDMITLSNDVINHEDYKSLYGGSDDGMYIIKQIINRLSDFCTLEGRVVLWMEVDPTHPTLLPEWLEKTDFHGYVVELIGVELDFNGYERFVKLSCYKKIYLC